jgi:uncharacterized phage protein (TIGR02218 family)
MFTAELRGLTQKLATSLGDTYGPTCRAELFSTPGGDDGGWRPWYCNLSAAPYQQSGSVSSSPDPMTLIPAGSLGAEGYFDNGMITFTSGVLSGKSFEVKAFDGTNLDMFLPFPQPPAPGDTFTIWPGCDKTAGATGCLKFNNIVNFRAEPFIPGMDLVLSYATSAL